MKKNEAAIAQYNSIKKPTKKMMRELIVGNVITAYFVDTEIPTDYVVIGVHMEWEDIMVIPVDRFKNMKGTKAARDGITQALNTDKWESAGYFIG